MTSEKSIFLFMHLFYDQNFILWKNSTFFDIIFDMVIFETFI